MLWGGTCRFQTLFVKRLKTYLRNCVRAFDGFRATTVDTKTCEHINVKFNLSQSLKMFTSQEPLSVCLPYS